MVTPFCLSGNPRRPRRADEKVGGSGRWEGREERTMGERSKYLRFNVQGFGFGSWGSASGVLPPGLGLTRSLAPPPHRLSNLVLVFVTTAAPAANSACFVSGNQANVRVIIGQPSILPERDKRIPDWTDNPRKQWRATDVWLDPLPRCGGELRHCQVLF